MPANAGPTQEIDIMTTRPQLPALSFAQRSLILVCSLAVTATLLGANLGLARHYAAAAEAGTLQAQSVQTARLQRAHQLVAVAPAATLR